MAFKLQRPNGFGLVHLLGATGYHITVSVSIAFQRPFVQLPSRLVQFTFYSVRRRPNVQGCKELPVLGLGRVFV